MVSIFILLKRLISCYKEKKKVDEDTELENYYNTKYPQKDLTYKRVEKDGLYQIDLRNFITQYDATIPTVKGKDDDEIALNGLKYVTKNIKYVSDITQYKHIEFWSYPYQTLKHRMGDCEDGAILLYNILLKSGIPYWKLRLTAGFVDYNNKQVGHAYLLYYTKEHDKWVILDWCYWPNLLKIKDRPHYAYEDKYKDVWFSWNQKYCFATDLKKEAKKILNGR